MTGEHSNLFPGKSMEVEDLEINSFKISHVGFSHGIYLWSP